MASCKTHHLKQGTWGGPEGMVVGDELITYKDKTCNECGKPCDREIIGREKMK